MRTAALLMLVVLLVAGCLGPTSDPAEPDPAPTQSGTPDDPERPRGPDAPVVGIETGLPSFEAVGCDVHFLEFVVDKGRAQQHLPDSLWPSGTWAQVQHRIFECDALLLGNQSVQRDGWFAMTYIRVGTNETEWTSSHYLVEAFSGWSELGHWFQANGASHRNGTIAVVSTPDGAEGRLSADGVEYAFQALPRDPGEAGYTPTRSLLLAGPQAAGRMEFSTAGPMQQPLVSGTLFESSGGALGDMVGTGPCRYQYAQMNVQIKQAKEVEKNE